MPNEFKVLSIDDLIATPSRSLNSIERGRTVAEMLTIALNELSFSGWSLLTTYRGADNTLFIFQKIGK